MYKFFLPVNYFVVPAGSIVLNNCLKSHRLEWKAGILHFECVCVIPAFVLINIIVCFFYLVLHVIFAQSVSTSCLVFFPWVSICLFFPPVLTPNL